MTSRDCTLSFTYGQLKSNFWGIAQLAFPWLLLAVFGASLEMFMSGPGPDNPNYLATAGLNLSELMAEKIVWHDDVQISPMAIAGQVIFLIALCCFWAEAQRYWAGFHKGIDKSATKLVSTLLAGGFFIYLLKIGYMWLGLSLGSDLMAGEVDEAEADMGFLDGTHENTSFFWFDAAAVLMTLTVNVVLCYALVRLMPALAAMARGEKKPFWKGWRASQSQFIRTVFRLFILTLPVSLVTYQLRVVIEMNKAVLLNHGATLAWAFCKSMGYILIIQIVTMYVDLIYKRLYSETQDKPNYA